MKLPEPKPKWHEPRESFDVEPVRCTDRADRADRAADPSSKLLEVVLSSATDEYVLMTYSMLIERSVTLHRASEEYGETAKAIELAGTIIRKRMSGELG